MTKLAKIIFIIVLSAPFVFAQPNEPLKDSRYYERLAYKAYQDKDFSAFLENLRQADGLLPNHPRITYNLAIAYTKNGRASEAIALLNKLAAMKLYFPIGKDDDFSPLKENVEFQIALKNIALNSQPIGNSEKVLTVAEKALVPESVAYDEKTKNFYLSSVAQRKILRVNKNGKATIFADQNAGLWSVFGIKVDAKRRILWATIGAHPQMPDLKKDEDGMSGILKFDLKSGKLLKKYLLPNKPKPHWLGDLAIAPNGDVYATDSISPAIYVIRQNKDEIEPFLENKSFGSPQGLDFTPDGNFLFIADYSRGIFKINLANKDVIKLEFTPNSTMFGIDGLYFYRNSLIGVQNGVEPERLVRMYLSKNLEKVERYEILAANNPLFNEMTLGALIKNEFYFVANSQWSLLGDGGKMKTPEKLTEVNILKINLAK